MLCKVVSSIDKVLQLVNEIQEWEVQTDELGVALVGLRIMRLKLKPLSGSSVFHGHFLSQL